MDAFACPHCEAAYPADERLLGRALRCRSCRQIFKVSRYGVVSAPEAGSVAAPPAEADDEVRWQSPRTRSADAHVRNEARKISSDKHKAFSLSSQASEAYERKIDPALREALTGRQAGSDATTRLKSRLSGDLNRLANDALKAAPKTVETGTGSKSSRRFVAVTSDSGREAGKQRRVWLLILTGILAIIALIAYAVVSVDPLTKALQDFTDQRQSSGNRLVDELAEQQVLTSGSLTPITHIDDARIGPVRSLPLAELLNLVGPRRPVRGTPFWAPPEQHVVIAAAWDLVDERKAETVRVFDSTSALQRWDLIREQKLFDNIAGLSPGGELLRDLMLAPPRPLIPHFRQAVFDGTLPTRIEFAHFSGREGRLHLVNSTGVAVAFEGVLMRGYGSGWPERWLVAQLRPRQ